MICGGASKGADIAKGGSLCVGTLGGLRLGGDVFFFTFKCHGLQGEKLIDIRTGLWWCTGHALLRVRG